MRRSRLRRSAVTATLCGALLTTSGCGTTNPDPADYREQASLALGTAVSELATTRLYLRQLDEEDAFRTSATTQIRYSDESLGSQAQSFGTLNPPPGLDPLYKRCTTLLGDAQDLEAQVRIAVHRDDAARYAGLAKRLQALGSRIEKLENRVSS